MSEVNVERGIVFAKADGADLKGDLYRPARGGKHPVLVALHGGGWQMGGPERYRMWGPWFAERGIALFATTYRFSRADRAGYPGCFHDARAAVQFVRSNAARLGLDGERIGMIGDSAGGHLAALVALAGDRPESAPPAAVDAYPGVSTRVRAVASIYGVYDLAAQWEWDQVNRPLDSITTKLLGARLPENRRVFFDASPLSYMTADNAQTAFMIIHGTADDIVDPDQAVRFIRAIKQANGFVRPLFLSDAPHFWIDDPIDEPTSYGGFCAMRILRFLESKL